MRFCATYGIGSWPREGGGRRVVLYDQFHVRERKMLKIMFAVELWNLYGLGC